MQRPRRAHPSDARSPHVTELRWLGSVRADLRAMPADVRSAFGFALLELQRGRTPEIAVRFGEGLDRRVWKLRYDGIDANSYRLAYVAMLPEAIYVLDVFAKKSTQGRSTPLRDRQRLVARLKRALADYRTRSREAR